MHIRLVFTIILAVISLYAQGQNTLTKEANAMRDNDHYTLKGGDTGHIYVNTSGLLPGKYVIYINVNGKVYSKTLNLA